MTHNDKVKIIKKNQEESCFDTEQHIALQCFKDVLEIPNGIDIQLCKSDTSADVADSDAEIAASDVPKPRWGASMTHINNGKWLLTGGEDPQSSKCETMIYDETTESWSPLSENCNRCWHSAVYLADKNNVLIHGGRIEDEEFSTTEVFDTEIELWYPLVTSGASPHPRFGHACCILNDGMFVHGGQFGKRLLDSLERLDTESWRWITVEPSGKAPSPRVYHTMQAITQDQMIVCGGMTKGQRVLNDLHVLTYRSQDSCYWSTPVFTGLTLAPRCGHVALKLEENKIAILGGWDPETENVYNDIAILDMETSHLYKPSGLWKQASSDKLTTGVAGHSCDWNGEEILCFGGLVEIEKCTSDLQSWRMKSNVAETVTPSSKVGNQYDTHITATRPHIPRSDSDYDKIEKRRILNTHADKSKPRKKRMNPTPLPFHI